MSLGTPWQGAVAAAWAVALGCFAAGAEETPDFGRAVRPILAGKCFKCHGPDDKTRQGGLRLDTFEGAAAALKSGKRAIAPGDPGASHLLERIATEDPDDRMPPPSTNLTVTPEETAVLRAWIAGGAPYAAHWSFVAPQRAALPPVQRIDWARNGLDRFILAALEREGLVPSPEADRETLIRRVYLDLIGTPPSPAEVKAFVEDASPAAYETVVERLLASPHYGERWARLWLDLARYADTKGYEKDDRRTIWRYRDWVIDAFNRDLPYDQFTAEQLAGDLLPDATPDQLLATAFHRNTMNNDEGGTDDEEFRNAAIVDRVNTTMTVWMGMTMACAQCHTHKYDPLMQREFYEFYAFFNQTEDADVPSEAPTMPMPTPEQALRLRAIESSLGAARAQLDAAVALRAEAQPAWEASALAEAQQLPALGTWHAAGPFAAPHPDTAYGMAYPPEQGVDLAAAYLDGAVAWAAHPEWADGAVYTLPGDIAAHYLYRTIAVSAARPAFLLLGSNDAIRVWLNGKEVHGNNARRAAGPDQDRVGIELAAGENRLLMKIVNAGGACEFFFRIDMASMPEAVLAALQKPAAGRTPEEAAAVRAHYAQTAVEFAPLRERVTLLEKERAGVASQVPAIPIMRDRPPSQARETHVHERGSFLTPGVEVVPDVPKAFHPLPPDAPRNRLTLAHWLTDRANPLTARVAVNRHWEQFFGTGIVQTVEDFGTQGDWPTHPELLDWLAVEFMDRGWSFKELCRLIVTSAAYRQASDAAPALHERDPYNRLLARGPRYRLDAETVRDQALEAAGLLSDAMYGPSVMPPQPDGIWNAPYSSDRWVTSKGGDRYRRGLYTFWRRTAPYPSMVTFDAGSREVCTARRIRTNTPLQAMVTLNDPVYIEAAQALARRIIAEGGSTPAERAKYGFQLAAARTPKVGEMIELTNLYADSAAHFEARPDDAKKMAEDPLGPAPAGVAPAEAAAWTVVANVLLNLDEVLNKT